MATGALFDTVAVVDWSASNTPRTGADSIWIAVAGGDGCTIENVRTRHEAVATIAALAQPGRRTLLGVDFSLGFPRGTAAALGLAGSPWERTWQLLAAEITDDERNVNNRFDVADRLNRTVSPGPGPFWGCPPARSTAALSTTRPTPNDAWPPVWRHVEAHLRESGHRPFSAWQLLGAGSVGSQSLVGIAALARLRATLGARLAVWPFSTGLAAPDGGADVVVAEVWPSMWPYDVPAGAVKDAVQVETTAAALTTLDRRGALVDRFTPPLDEGIASDVVGEEGWVLGVGGSC
ncbi:MAG: cobalamin biosynthesis protein CbiG [Ilumatobacter sp.]|nr:cobalamin biosynthesis protein CbiG [Ilumatobacter sp.]